MLKPVKSLRLKKLSEEQLERKKARAPVKMPDIRHLVTTDAARKPLIIKKPILAKAPAISEVAADPRDLPGWSAVILRDEATGKRVYQFSIPDGRGGLTKCEQSMAFTEGQIVRELRAYGDLPRAPNTAEAAVRKLLAAASGSVFIKASQPGWRGMGDASGSPSAFVLPSDTIPVNSEFHWSAGNRSSLGRARGTLDSWNKSVSVFASSSNAAAFAILAALAAPLVRLANLPESAVFNFVGPSSTGKTRLAMLAQSTIAPPDSISTWDFKNRALEEAAAQHNDCPLIMNGAERLTVGDRRKFMTAVVHMLPDGEGTVRSDAVGETLPNLTWRNIVISTSNYTGSEMAGPTGAWNEQELVRFIDIPIDPASDGGIFDRLKSGPDLDQRASRMIDKIDAALASNHGVLWPRYIEHLMTLDLCVVIAGHMEEYLRDAVPTPGIEERIARKFALCYAAGAIAQAAGLLSWQRARVLHAVREMHKRSISMRGAPSFTLNTALIDLRSTLDQSSIHDLSKGRRVVVDGAASWFGIKTMHKKRIVVGFRREDLAIRYGSQTACAMISLFNSKGMLSDGGTKGTQILMDLRIGSERWRKPRFVLVDYDLLQNEVIS